jgi:hypothetical protein
MVSAPWRAGGTTGGPDNPLMHLLIPFASALSAPATQVLHELRLPQLERCLARLSPTLRDEADASSPLPPHERALAAAWGWAAQRDEGDGNFPFAARAAAADGVAVGDLAWGLVTPAHWRVGRDHVLLADPAELQLDAAESRALFDEVRGLFESEGFRLAWGAPLRWYAAHESLAGLACASLDRAIGRNVEPWLPQPPHARLVRRLQSEVQLLLYPHPINEAREARGALSVNSFWLSGCGRFQASAGAALQVDERLRAPLLAEDWAGWAEAWRALDGTAIAALAQAAHAGQEVCLTLCGERAAQRFEPRPQSFTQRLAGRWKAAGVPGLLEGL